MAALAPKRINTYRLYFPPLLLIFFLHVFVSQGRSTDAKNFNVSPIPTYKQCICDFCQEIQAVIPSQIKKKSTPKNWTIVIYMAADNDLRHFAARNIKQMAAIGSNKYANILVHLDIKITGNIKVTRRYYIEKDRIIHMNAQDPASQCMDSGNPQTLISCCNWAVNNHPAYEYALFFWNHGTGIVDPSLGRLINPAELFTFNRTTNKLELDRSIGFLDLISKLKINDFLQTEQRGICWNDTTGNYLTNQKLTIALNTICQDTLNGEKFSIIGFDACLMAMLEVANLVKPYAHIMVASQEVELGTGWNYRKVLAPFLHEIPKKITLAKHIVQSYHTTYSMITNDFSLSAINLDTIIQLEENLSRVALLLIECLEKQKNKSVFLAIKASRNRLMCTHFDEPSYIDLHHFYSNLQKNIRRFIIIERQKNIPITEFLYKTLEQGKALIKEIVFANTVGKNLKNAKGISIYFPENKTHSSYQKTPFFSVNAWPQFLSQYLLS